MYMFTPFIYLDLCPLSSLLLFFYTCGLLGLLSSDPYLNVFNGTARNINNIDSDVLQRMLPFYYYSSKHYLCFQILFLFYVVRI
jgi:hypothetical protein